MSMLQNRLENERKMLNDKMAREKAEEKIKEKDEIITTLDKKSEIGRKFKNTLSKSFFFLSIFIKNIIFFYFFIYQSFSLSMFTILCPN